METYFLQAIYSKSLRNYVVWKKTSTSSNTESMFFCEALCINANDYFNSLYKWMSHNWALLFFFFTTAPAHLSAVLFFMLTNSKRIYFCKLFKKKNQSSYHFMLLLKPNDTIGICDMSIQRSSYYYYHHHQEKYRSVP